MLVPKIVIKNSLGFTFLIVLLFIERRVSVYGCTMTDLHRRRVLTASRLHLNIVGLARRVLLLSITHSLCSSLVLPGESLQI